MKNIRLERHMYSLNLKSNDRQCFSWSILKHIPFNSFRSIIHSIYICAIVILLLNSELNSGMNDYLAGTVEWTVHQSKLSRKPSRNSV